MNIKKLAVNGFMAGVVAVVTGCTTAPVAFSDKSVPMEQGKYSVLADEVEGSDSQLILLGFGFSMPGSAQRRALSQALQKAPGADGLISMAIDQQVLNLVAVQLVTTRVTGTPVKTMASDK